MKNILVLGVSGMLGSMVFDYLSKNPDLNTYGTVRDPKYKRDKVFLFDANDISQLETARFLDLKIEYIINCIGIIKPFSKDDDPIGVKRAIAINAKFPWELANHVKKYNMKVLQIATDCVYSGKKGNYIEDDPHDPLDVYGKSKSLGEVFDGSALLIRCSIIGPELKEQKSSLYEWFLSQEKGSTIGGYEHHNWNGVTTLQFAQLCEKIIILDKYDELIQKSPIQHFIQNPTVNKFELMHIFNDVFNKGLQINRVNVPDQSVDRSLSTKYHFLENLVQKTDMKTAILKLKEYELS
ncbi:MAG: sugar nucleotide-binding protein [Promethearchaeota archaeon]